MISLSKNNVGRRDGLLSKLYLPPDRQIMLQINNQVYSQVRDEVYWMAVNLVGNEVKHQACAKLINEL